MSFQLDGGSAYFRHRCTTKDEYQSLWAKFSLRRNELVLNERSCHRSPYTRLINLAGQAEMFLVRHVYLYNPPWLGPSEGSPQRLSENLSSLIVVFWVFFVTVSMEQKVPYDRFGDAKNESGKWCFYSQPAHRCLQLVMATGGITSEKLEPKHAF